MNNDPISRQAAIEAIEKLYLPLKKGETAEEEINRVAWRCALNCAEQIVGNLPTIDPVKHAHWRYDREGDDYICSECGSWGAIGMSYCPWCGARMDKKEE